MQGYPNIRRIDDDLRRTHAWLVQVQRKHQIVVKLFSDNVFGGKEKALSAALRYRDALIIAASPAAHNRWHRSILRRNNKSGIPGVGLYKRPNGTERWVAYWEDENGRKRSRTFSVKLYGNEKARELAIAERKKQLQRLFEIKSAMPLKQQASPTTIAHPESLRLKNSKSK